MGIFSGKKEDKNTDIDMLVSTTERLDRDFEILGLVSVSSAKISTDIEALAKKLAEKASTRGADAIVAFKYQNDGALQFAYGTAVKYK